jgi:hypothetical protein
VKVRSPQWWPEPGPSCFRLDPLVVASQVVV